MQIAAGAVQHEGVDVSVLHWDTPSVYLEGAYDENDLAEYGHSSDGHPDHKQVKLGVDVTSRDRVPLLYQLLAGATANLTTPMPHLKALAAFLQRPECAALAVQSLVVGDGKMITPAAVAAAHAYHLCYLGPWEADNTVNAVIRSASDAAWAQTELDAFADTTKIAQEAKQNPQLLKHMPHDVPRRRLDEVRAAKQLVLCATFPED